MDVEQTPGADPLDNEQPTVKTVLADLRRVPIARLLATAFFIVWAILFARFSWEAPVDLPVIGRTIPIATDAERALFDWRQSIREPQVAEDQRIVLIPYTQDTLRATAKRSPLALSNPFSLAAATRFAAVFAAVLLVVKIAERYAPQQGTYVVAALAGSVDVDAITLSMADSARDANAFAHATTAIVVAIVANSVVKCGAVLLLGAGRLRRSIVVATVAVLAAGLAALALR